MDVGPTDSDSGPYYIVSLEGIQNLTSLTFLRLYNNELSDIDPRSSKFGPSLWGVRPFEEDRVLLGKAFGCATPIVRRWPFSRSGWF